MNTQNIQDQFHQAALAAGAVVTHCLDVEAVAEYIALHAEGPVLFAPNDYVTSLGMYPALQRQGVDLLELTTRGDAAEAVAGVTGCNHALAETGTLVVDSTPEIVRLASTLPERHFAILDPTTIVQGQPQAGEALAELQSLQAASFMAYITGPSRTADIERVLTIGVHGPRELHILLLEPAKQDSEVSA